MVDSIGKQLKDARLAKGLTLEDVAHHTKVRVRHLADLENDDFSNFPSLVYTRGFLTIYARYLGIDVSHYLDQFEAGSTVSLEGYEYLNAGHAASPQMHREFIDNEKSTRSVWPWLLFIVLLVLIGLGWLFLNESLKRLEGSAPVESAASQTPAEETAAPIVTPVASPMASPTATPAPPPAPIPASTPHPTPNVEISPEMQRVIPMPEAVPVDRPSNNTPEYELEIRPLGNTTIRVIKNQIDSAPAFNGAVDAEAEPLIFRGNRFWLSFEDASAVDVRRNGQPVPIPSTNEIFIE